MPDTCPIERSADRRWWHVELGDGAARWTMDVRVDEVTGVRFGRGPYPFPSFPGREVLTVEFRRRVGEDSLGCWVHDLCDGERMRPERPGGLACAARTVRQPRRVQGRWGQAPAPGCLNQPDH